MPISRVNKAINLQRCSAQAEYPQAAMLLLVKRAAILMAAVSSALVFTTIYNAALATSDLAVNNDLEARIISVLPDKQEDTWLKIGWHTNLMQARAIAQKEHRPLFLWIMNGHPLGCT